MTEKTQLTLSELASKVKQALSDSLPGMHYLVAEISELKENSTGHCYLELVEKNEKTQLPVARASATIWAYTWRMLKPYFETTTGQKLSKGMKVLVFATVEYHELYGFSLNIKDIDPTYTVGEMALARQQVIAQLQSDGIFDMNKSIEMPKLPQRIALISSSTAAGYGDFMKHIAENEYGYHFSIELFASLMQGASAAKSIITSLDAIYNRIDEFDIVIILRGGGARTDLLCFDDYALASNVAQFPLPVITGIGHEQDDSVTDMVAHTRMKTPTAVADFLIGLLNSAEEELLGYYDQMVEYVQQVIDNEKNKFERLSLLFPTLVRSVVDKNKKQLDKLSMQLPDASKRATHQAMNNLQQIHRRSETSVQRLLYKQENKLNTLIQVVKHSSKKSMREHLYKLDKYALLSDGYDPKHILSRGYSLSLVDGKIIRSVDQLEAGSKIETRLYSGTFESIVTDIKK